MTTDTPNVLLVVLDSVRARNTSFSDRERDTTPNIRALAASATVYENAVTPGLASIPSHVSIFTGHEVAQHRIVSEKYKLTADTIWDTLAQHGYETGIFSQNAYLTQISTGLSRPFDHVEATRTRSLPFPDGEDTGDIKGSKAEVYVSFLKKSLRSDTPLKSLANGVAVQANDLGWVPYSLDRRSGRDVTRAFAEWHAERTGSWAACINYMDAHTPYLPESEYNEWASPASLELSNELEDHKWEFVSGMRSLSELQSLESVYDNCVLQADAEVGKLVQILENRGELRNTLVVVTADHGEGFGEKGTVHNRPSIGHGGTGGPEEGILHVPLVVKYPGQAERARVSEPVSLTQFSDVVRTVLTESWTTDAFVSDRPVVASSFGLSMGEDHSKPSYITDVAEYNKKAKVVYERINDGEIHKYVVYGDEAFAFDVTKRFEPKLIESTERTPVQVVDQAFDELGPVKGERHERTEELAGETRQQLEDLGYR